MDREHSPQSTAIRGVVLLVVLAALGALIVNKGFHGDDSTDVITGSGTTTTATTVVGGTTTVDPTATTIAVATSTASSVSTDPVRVIVANGKTGVKGAAARMGNTLKAAGFTVLTPVNALESVGTVAKTIVYYVEGNQAQADSVANAIKTSKVTPPVMLMPDPLPIKVAELGEAQVLVLLGTDLAA
ncbi:MAG: LytR C-terminal domain-containing protein [Acidimicrobiia bacterium]